MNGVSKVWDFWPFGDYEHYPDHKAGTPSLFEVRLWAKDPDASEEP